MIPTLHPHFVEVAPYKIVDDSFTWKRFVLAASAGKVSRKLLRGLAAVFFLASFFCLRLSSAVPDTEPLITEESGAWLDEDEFIMDSGESNPHLLHTSSLPNVYLQGNSCSSTAEPFIIGPLEVALFMCFFTSSFWVTIHVLCKDKSSRKVSGSPSDNKAT